jgi:putative hemolysin
MASIGTEVLLVLLLLVVNGVFAMSEIAVVSSRKARLQQRAEGGNAGARRALELAEKPERFLATVQVGITLVGTLAGAFGGAAIAEPLADSMERNATLAPYADALAFGIVVVGITYFSLIIGELVPKQIGLNNPERVASAVAGPMHLLSRVAAPLVWLLTSSTQGVLRLLRIRAPEGSPVTEAEISVLMEQGTQAGVFEEEEQDLVERVFWLGDQRAVGVMTPRHRIVWLDVNAPFAENRERMIRHHFSRYLLCEGALDRVLGIVEVKHLWSAELAGEPVEDLRRFLKAPHYIPESTRALRILEKFRESGTHMAVVVDEYGGMEGLVTLNDILEEIAGSMTHDGPGATTAPVIRRDDGTWLVDGSLSIEEFRELLDLEDRRHESREYQTVGGFVFTRIGHVPAPGEHFMDAGHRIEVMDMDGNRVDKILVTPATAVRAPRDGGE